MKLSPKAKIALCVLTLLLLAAALFVRAPYGLDWTDEPYYSVLPYRLWLCDRPLVDTWEVHQLSGLITLPFLALYLLVTGGATTGIMLYFRYALLCVQLLISLYAYRVLRRKSGDLVALLAAGMLLAHVHFGINSLSYNALTPLLLALSALLTFDALDGGRKRLCATLAGIAYALAVQAYPYAVLTLPVYALFWIAHAKKFRDEPVSRRLWLRFACGVAAVALLFIATVLARSAPADILANIGSILHDPDHQTTGILRLIASYGNATRVLFGPVFVAAMLLTVYSLATRFVKSPRALLRMRQLGLAFAIAVLAASILWVIPYDYPLHHKLNLTAMSVTLILPSIWALSGFRRSRYFLLIGLGALLSLSVQLGSNTGIRSSSGMLLLCSVGTMLYLFALLDDEVPRPYGAHAFRAAAAVVCACQLALTTGLRLCTVYRDAPLAALDTRLAAGPAKGIVTTRDNAIHYGNVLLDMAEFAPEEGSVLITNLLPVAYLMTTCVPATPSAFNMTADSSWLAEYYEKHPERKPDLLYAADASVGQSNELSLSGAAALADTLGLFEREGRAGVAFTD